MEKPNKNKILMFNGAEQVPNIAEYSRQQDAYIDHLELVKSDFMHDVSKPNCPECKSIDIKTAMHTDYKECNNCYHFWEADC